MLSSVATKWLWDARRSVGAWTLAIALVGGTYAAFWPIIDSPEIQEGLESYPEGLLDALNYDDLSTPAGYLTASVYGLIVAVLLLVYSLVAGTRTIAGDEEAGTLELIMAQPVSRTRVALSRFVAFLISLVIIAVVFLLVMVALSGPADLSGITVGQFAAMHLHLFLFASFFGAVTFAVGAATGRRGLAYGAGAAVGVLGYFASGIIPQVDGFEWVEAFSPFDWLIGSDPLRDGVDPADTLLMAVLVSVLVAAGTWRFNRRDVGV